MNRHKIENVLPHQAPMILIDTLVSYDQNSCICQVNITSQSVFYDSGKKGVPSYIGCEYMAQAIAAFAGATSLDSQGEVSIGFLLGSRKFKTEQSYFPLGCKLHIITEELYKEESGLRVFGCKIVDENDHELTYASANINVFQPDNPEAFINQYS